jgi:hypothetical protein
MESVITFATLVSPPFVSYLLVKTRLRSVALYWVLLIVLVLPIATYWYWTSQKTVLERPEHYRHPLTMIASTFLIILCIALPLTSVWFVNKVWAKVILALLIYVAMFFLAIVIAVNLGMFEG